MKPCKTCPFLIDTKNFGSIDWIEDVFYLVRNGIGSHSCHVTDKDADGYVGGKRRNCAGLEMLKSNEAAGIHIYNKAFKNYKSCLSAHLKENLKAMGVEE